MTIQQWLFSFKGRIGRRDFWIWIGLWLAGMLVLFSLAGKNLLDIQTAAFCLVCLLWPTAAVTVKRPHRRTTSYRSLRTGSKSPAEPLRRKPS